MPWISSLDLSPTLSEFSDNEVLQIYNGFDTAITLEIFEALSAQHNTFPEVYSFARALQGPVLDMMRRGWKVDQESRHEAVEELNKRLARLEKILNAYANAVWDRGLNANSPQQIKDFLYKRMRLPEQWISKKGESKLSTDREALEKLLDYYHARPIVLTILAIRDVKKQLSVLQTEIDHDGRIRSSFNIAGTETARFSSSGSAWGTGTNLQNIAPALRFVFCADWGKKIVAIDLEQAESREVGWLCGTIFDDWSYLNACYSGDLHTLTCRLIWPDLPWTGDKKKDRAIADQIFYREYSYRDMSKRGGHGCLTEDHEVLTPEGWVPISSCPKTIMAWNQNTKEMRWEKVSNWLQKPWFDDLYEILGNQYDMTATSDHRMPVFSKRGTSRECPAENFLHLHELNLRHQGFFIGGTAKVTPNQARLCAAAQADGHIYPNGAVRFGFSRSRKKDRLKELLGDAFVKITEYQERDETYYHIPAEYVNFPAEKEAGTWMLNWPKEALEAWVDELKFWDGTIQPRFTWIYGKSREHMHWMYTIATLVGQSASYCHNKGFTCARVGLNRRNNVRIGNLKVSKISGQGQFVYCPTVPSGGFLVKRNDKIMFSLNSNYYGTPVTMARHLKVPTKMMELFQERYFSAFPGIPKWHKYVAQQLQTTQRITTPWGRTRTFFGRPNDDSTLREAIAYSPQSSTADRMNLGLYRLWQQLGNRIQLLAQVHDAVYFQINESDDENEIVAKALEIIDIPLVHGTHRLIVPGEAKTGWNWGNYCCGMRENGTCSQSKAPCSLRSNPNGLKKLKGPDTRTRVVTTIF